MFQGGTEELRTVSEIIFLEEQDSVSSLFCAILHAPH